MADENSGAASSTVLEVPREPAAYAEWRKTGKVPEARAAEAQPEGGSAPHKDKSEAAAAAESGQASEAGTKGKQEKPRSNAETRLNEILEDLRRAGLSPAELKTYKREAQRADGGQQPHGDGKAAPPEKTEKPAKLEPPKAPQMEDFKDWDSYQQALKEYPEKLAEFLRRSTAEEFETRQRQEAAQREAREKIDAAKKRYGDEAEKTIRETATTLFADKSVAVVVKAMLNESPHLADLAYVLGSKPEDLSAFLKMSAENPGAAVRKIALMEKLIEDELAKAASGSKAGSGGAAGEGSESGGGPVRDASGKFVAPAGKATSAPPPPKDLGGGGSPPPDEVASAVKAGDFRSFRSASNRRDLARHKGS